MLSAAPAAHRSVLMGNSLSSPDLLTVPGSDGKRAERQARQLADAPSTCPWHQQDQLQQGEAVLCQDRQLAEQQHSLRQGEVLRLQQGEEGLCKPRDQQQQSLWQEDVPLHKSSEQGQLQHERQLLRPSSASALPSNTGATSVNVGGCSSNSKGASSSSGSGSDAHIGIDIYICSSSGSSSSADLASSSSCHKNVATGPVPNSPSYPCAVGGCPVLQHPAPPPQQRTPQAGPSEEQLQHLSKQPSQHLLQQQPQQHPAPPQQQSIPQAGPSKEQLQHPLQQQPQQQLQQQLWQVVRPVLSGCPMRTRRQLRAVNKAWSLAEVRQHCYKDDAWIAVDGKVYDITQHLVDHPGWETGAGTSTILSILAHAGTECTHEFNEIHRNYPIAFKQLRAYYIGELA